MTHSFAMDHPCSPEQLVEIRQWNEQIFSFTSTRPLALNFLPGQYARIALQSGSQLIWRPFSFVSAPSDHVIEFLAVLVPGGLFTDRLKQAEAGDTLWVEHENYGFMTEDRFSGGKHLWMLATGTGIGAFISILRDASVWSRYKQIVVVHGVRKFEDLVYRAELDQIKSEKALKSGQAKLAVIDCVTGNNDAKAENSISRNSGASKETTNRILCMRMSQAWDEGLLEKASGLPINPEDSRVMLCGNPGMIGDMRKRLHQRGLAPCRRQTPGQFLTENYW